MIADFGSVADTAAAGWSDRHFELRWDSVLYPRHSLNILSQLGTLFQRMVGRIGADRVAVTGACDGGHGKVQGMAAATENLVELVGLAAHPRVDTT